MNEVLLKFHYTAFSIDTKFHSNNNGILLYNNPLQIPAIQLHVPGDGANESRFISRRGPIEVRLQQPFANVDKYSKSIKRQKYRANNAQIESQISI